MDLLVSGLQSSSNNLQIPGKVGGEAAQVARENCVSACKSSFSSSNLKYFNLFFEL